MDPISLYNPSTSAIRIFPFLLSNITAFQPFLSNIKSPFLISFDCMVFPPFDDLAGESKSKNAAVG
jgi:hypothetical protein